LFLSLLLELVDLLLLLVLLSIFVFLITVTLLLEVAEETFVLEESVVRVHTLLALQIARGELFGGVPPQGLVWEDTRVKWYVRASAVGLARTAHFVRSIAQHDALVVSDRGLGPVSTTAVSASVVATIGRSLIHHQLLGHLLVCCYNLCEYLRRSSLFSFINIYFFN
jgi:hypothetical protein